MKLKAHILWCILCVAIIVACADNSMPTSTSATYKVTFTTFWSVANNGGNGLPGGAHFTTMVVATHNSAYSMWESGALASSGAENVAENGVTGTLMAEIDTQIASGTVYTQTVVSGGGASGSRNSTVDVSSDFPLISLMSMLAPSSDWFVGASALSLVDEDGMWISSITRNLRVYDAGTEQEGAFFSLNNLPEDPHKPIMKIEGSSVVGFQESENQHIVGSLTFELQDN